MTEPVKLPIEEHLRESAHAAADPLRKLAIMLERVLFGAPRPHGDEALRSGTPLWRLECGLHAGRDWRRSPLVWLIALAVLQMTQSLLQAVLAWFTPLESNTSTAVTALRSVLQWLSVPLNATEMLSLWLCAASWARERSPGALARLAARPATAREMLMAKSVIWALPAFGVFVFGTALGLADFLLAWFLAPEGSAASGGGAMARGRMGFGSLLSSMLLGTAVGCCVTVASLVFRFGLVTRLTLRWPCPGLVVFVVWTSLWLLGRIWGALMLSLIQRAAGPGSALNLLQVLSWLALGVAALIVCRGLPDRVNALSAGSRST